jgi:formiminotetrahydrofolate cyclodeaminase
MHTFGCNGAYLNVKINASSLKDKVFVDDILQKADDLLMKTKSMEETILTKVNNKL